MKQIHLTEKALKGMISEAIAECMAENYADVRPNTTKMFDYIEEGIVDTNELAKNLLGYLSDDEVGEFMRVNGYLDDYDDDDDYDGGDDTINEAINRAMKKIIG